MMRVRMVRSYSGKLGDVWNPQAGDEIEVTAANAELLVGRWGAAVEVGKGGGVETRATGPAEPAASPAKKPAVKKAAAKRRRRTSKGDG